MEFMDYNEEFKKKIDEVFKLREFDSDLDSALSWLERRAIQEKTDIYEKCYELLVQKKLNECEDVEIWNKTRYRYGE